MPSSTSLLLPSLMIWLLILGLHWLGLLRFWITPAASTAPKTPPPRPSALNRSPLKLLPGSPLLLLSTPRFNLPLNSSFPKQLQSSPKVPSGTNLGRRPCSMLLEASPGASP